MKMSRGYKVYESSRSEEDRTELERRNDDEGGAAAWCGKCLVPCCLCWICTALVGIAVALLVLFICYLPGLNAGGKADPSVNPTIPPPLVRNGTGGEEAVIIEPEEEPKPSINIDIINQKVTLLNQRVDALSVQFRALKSYYEEMKGRVRSLESGQSHLGSGLKALETNFNSHWDYAKKKFSQLESGGNAGSGRIEQVTLIDGRYCYFSTQKMSHGQAKEVCRRKSGSLLSYESGPSFAKVKLFS